MAIGDLVTEDYGFEYRGLAFGGTSDLAVPPGIRGLADNADVQSSDRTRLRRHGLHPGDDFLLDREVIVPIEVTADSTALWETNLDNLKTAMRTDHTRGEEPLVFQVPGVAGGGKRRILVRPRGLAADLDLDWFYEIPVQLARFYATKPFIYDNDQTQVVSTILTAASSGLTWPLTWPLNWGTVSATSFTTTNDGNTDAEWVATIPGPVTNPQIQHVDQGLNLTFSIELTAGQELIVDSDSRTVLLDGTASRYSTLSGDWFALTPGANELSYRADAGSSIITISYRSTWS